MKEQKEQVEQFAGRSSAMRAENRWLGAEDIYGYGDVRVTIAAVLRYMNVKFEGGRTKKEVFALRFEGKKKELILSPTKRRPIVIAWGTDTRDWIGKAITLYVDMDVPKPGTSNERTWGIRVRDIPKTAQHPESRPQPPPKTSMPDNLDQWVRAVEKIESVEQCAELQELLPDCPESIRAHVEYALGEREAKLKEAAG